MKTWVIPIHAGMRGHVAAVTKFWTNLSEITAYLPPYIINFSILKDKLNEIVAAVMAAVSGNWRQFGGRKTR